MPTLADIPVTCTVKQAADFISAIAPGLPTRTDPPDVRTLNLWRAQGHLTREERRMTRRNILEVLVILQLRAGGIALVQAAQRARDLTEEQLRLTLVDRPIVAAIDSETEATITVQHLARALLRQHRLVRSSGAIVGHTEMIDNLTPHTAVELVQAQARLSRHAMLSGEEDRYASVHVLMELCMRPLSEWAPLAVRSLTRYADVTLIHPDYRVPSDDCEAIAEEAGATSLSDLIEGHLHAMLRASVGPAGAVSDRAYTTIREFIARHPLATVAELRSVPHLNDAAHAFLQGLYEPVHAIHRHNGTLLRCPYCHGLITEQKRCVLESCAHMHSDTDLRASAIPISAESGRLALPEVLLFWADPAREELRLYDAACAIPQLRNQVRLYPHGDWCDVAIGETIGIDVKDHRNPDRLAQRLNASIGNLARYPRRIVAIADRRWRIPAYAERLRDRLAPDRRAQIEVMSVDMAIAALKQIAREGSYA